MKWGSRTKVDGQGRPFLRKIAIGIVKVVCDPQRHSFGGRSAMKFLVSVVSFAFLIAHCGCARGRASLPPKVGPSQDLGPQEITPEPIRASINEGKIPADRSTVRASYGVENPSESPTPTVAEEAPEFAPTPASSDDPAPTSPLPVVQQPKKIAAPAASQVKKLEDAPAGAMTIRTDPNLAPGKPASKTAAVVGDTIITARELHTAVCLKLNLKRGQLNQVPADQLNELARNVLETLIDRTLILQEGRREIKKSQQWNMFTDFVEKSWKEKELPAMLRKEGVEDEVSLRHKLETQGESFDDIKDAWKMETMSRDLLMMRVQPKVERPGLPELENYYVKHRKDASYHRDAKVKWREIVVPVANPKDVPAARQTALALRTKLVGGEDFAKLAKLSSAGVTADRGGAWETAVDGSATPGINVALEKLLPGQISQPIEGAKGIHLVRVEGRTVSGPASFVEVQRKIADEIFEQRFSDAIAAYLKKLRDKTSVTSPLFDLESHALKLAREKAKSDPETKPAALTK